MIPEPDALVRTNVPPPPVSDRLGGQDARRQSGSAAAKLEPGKVGLSAVRQHRCPERDMNSARVGREGWSRNRRGDKEEMSREEVRERENGLCAVVWQLFDLDNMQDGSDRSG